MTDLSNITVAILAGGLGTRLRPVIGERSKVLAEVSGRPFIAVLFDQLVGAGVREVVLCTGYRAAEVREALGTSYGPLAIRYSPESEPLGTAGAIRLALPLLDSDPVIVMNGDSHIDVELSALVDVHRARKVEATVALAWAEDAGRFGRVMLSDDDCVVRFEEKLANAGAGWINAGIYVLGRSFIDSIPTGRAVSFERDVFPSSILRRGVVGFRTGGQVMDIGTPGSFIEAQSYFTPQARNR